MRSYIAGYLTRKYNIIEAVNGNDGFEKAVAEIPDLIISDVMMPVKDIMSIDRQFLQKVKKIVAENISDFEFNTETFADIMNLSRTQLHRKLKALVNQSASDFIRTIRLNHAALLLRSKIGNITQVALESGFNNLSYYSKCFKEQFGMLPSEYENQNSKPKYFLFVLR